MQYHLRSGQHRVTLLLQPLQIVYLEVPSKESDYVSETTVTVKSAGLYQTPDCHVS